MKLSTKGRYGLKAMLDLAIHRSEGYVSIKTIAERQDISENYLEQLFAALRKGGLVRSIRGAQGGYVLGKEPADISIGSILRLLEGSLAPVECVTEDSPMHCNRSDTCVTKFVWEKIRDGINQVVDSISLEDLLNEYNSNKKNDGMIYYI